MAPLFHGMMLALLTIVSFQGYVMGQNAACQEIAKCLETPEFKNAIKNKKSKDFCGTLERGLACMDAKIQMCLPSLPDPKMGTMFTTTRDRMLESAENCRTGRGGSSSVSCVENVAKCTDGVESLAPDDLAATCMKVMEVKQCLKGVAPGCTGDEKESYDHSLKNIMILGEQCPGGVDQSFGGCTDDLAACASQMMAGAKSGDMDAMCENLQKSLTCIRAITSCDGSVKQEALDAAEKQPYCEGAGEGGDDMGKCSIKELENCGKEKPADLKEGCRMAPGVLKCLTTFDGKCSKYKMMEDVITESKQQVNTLIATCKEKGIPLGGNGGQAMTSSFLLLVVSTLLLAVRAHF